MIRRSAADSWAQREDFWLRVCQCWSCTLSSNTKGISAQGPRLCFLWTLCGMQKKGFLMILNIFCPLSFKMSDTQIVWPWNVRNGTWNQAVVASKYRISRIRQLQMQNPFFFIPQSLLRRSGSDGLLEIRLATELRVHYQHWLVPRCELQRPKWTKMRFWMQIAFLFDSHAFKKLRELCNACF